jgi:hypothetical protein
MNQPAPVVVNAPLMPRPKGPLGQAHHTPERQSDRYVCLHRVTAIAGEPLRTAVLWLRLSVARSRSVMAATCCRPPGAWAVVSARVPGEAIRAARNRPAARRRRLARRGCRPAARRGAQTDPRAPRDAVDRGATGRTGGTARICLRGAVYQARRPGALQYLTCWRMQHAQRLLRASNAGIAQIAAQAGCQTEPAFSLEFKHWAGIAPGACRRGR